MKNLFLLFVILLLCPCVQSIGNCHLFSLASSAGFVWKRDNGFKEVYGKGIADLITIDGCYYPSHYIGLGGKLSYWRAKGKTIALQKRSIIQEVPLLFYIRGIIGCWLQAYISLGGGFIFSKENSYLGTAKKIRGIAEAEAGINYYFYKNFYVTSAFHCLFPRQKIFHQRVDFGGIGLRAGLGITF